MMDFFNSLETSQKFFWAIAVCASLVFIIQTVLTFIGLGADTDVDAGPMDSAGDVTEDGGPDYFINSKNKKEALKSTSFMMKNRSKSLFVVTFFAFEVLRLKSQMFTTEQ